MNPLRSTRNPLCSLLIPCLILLFSSLGFSQAKLDLKADCGAVGDGKSDDTDAFQKAAKLLEEAGGCHLTIPAGTYIVGRQSHVEGKNPYYQSDPIFVVAGVKSLVIEGKSAVIRLADGLRYGTFDKDTGEVYSPKMPFTDYKYRVGDMPILFVRDSEDVVIRDLEIDGNSPALLLGGRWGDKGRQIQATGIHLHGCRKVRVSRIYSHHNALDGIAMGFKGSQEGDAPMDNVIEDCRFEYNGRQGFSWVGGIGLKVYRSQFNHTGRAVNRSNGEALASSPGAGLDIEAESAVIRDGYFEDCEFINNTGAGMVSDSGDGGYTIFKNCTFWGTTNWSIWVNKPGIKIIDSKIYGPSVHAFGSENPDLATQWVGCQFEDKLWEGADNKTSRFLLNIDGKAENVSLTDCTFTANNRRSIWISSKPPVSLTNCIFTHRFGGLDDHAFQALIRNAHLSGCHFQEDFSESKQEAEGKQWSIVAQSVELDPSSPTTVDGPQVKWKNWRKSGQTGVLKNE